MTVESRIAELETEIALLKTGKAQRPPQPTRTQEIPGTVTVTFPEPISSFVRPTSKELRQLFDVVTSKYPQLGPARSLTGRFDEENDDDFREGFCWSFERLGYIGRTSEPNHRFYLDHWITDTKSWLERYRPAHRGAIGPSFLAACLAHGDIPFTVGDPAAGVVWSVGVATYGGTAATDKWRAVLNGQLLAPVRPARAW